MTCLTNWRIIIRYFVHICIVIFDEKKLIVVYSLMLSSVKVPQILKILYASSAAGLSYASSCMELMAITGSLAYGFAMGFPFRFVHFFSCHMV